MKPQIEKAVNKFLGFGEPAIVTTAVNCITSGYDKRKTAGKNDKMCYIYFNFYWKICIHDFYNFDYFFFPDKLSALLEDKKASKLTEKIFAIYDDIKAAQKSKKRNHVEDKEKEKDAKKPKFKDDEIKNEKPAETQLSADKVI